MRHGWRRTPCWPRPACGQDQTTRAPSSITPRRGSAFSTRPNGTWDAANRAGDSCRTKANEDSDNPGHIVSATCTNMRAVSLLAYMRTEALRARLLPLLLGALVLRAMIPAGYMPAGDMSLSAAMC